VSALDLSDDDGISVGSALLSLVGAASVGAAAYHGYKRNRDSLGWALVWGVMGGVVPPLTLALAVGQGFGEPKSRR